MADTNATIMIPDISGFTEFITTTELTHSSLAINMLMDAMVTAVGDEYEISEIEGDAVLLIKKGPAPSQKEVQEIVLKIFNAFHFKRSWMQQYTVCPCGACQALVNLTLKFVVHHGPLAEIKVGRFIKHSGTEMIVAHRLLKNSINNNEYLLVTKKLLDHSPDSPGSVEMEWNNSSEEYASIGKVDYRFALLNEARKHTPAPPAPQNNYPAGDTSYIEIPVAANFLEVYMMIMNIPGRNAWMPGLQKVEQDIPQVFVGSIHRCSFDDYEAVISPLRMTSLPGEIFYAESCRIEALQLSLVHEFICKKTDEQSCLFATRFINTESAPVPEEINTRLLERTQLMAESLKTFFERK